MSERNLHRELAADEALRREPRRLKQIAALRKANAALREKLAEAERERATADDDAMAAEARANKAENALACLREQYGELECQSEDALAAERAALAEARERLTEADKQAAYWKRAFLRCGRLRARDKKQQ